MAGSGWPGNLANGSGSVQRCLQGLYKYRAVWSDFLDGAATAYGGGKGGNGSGKGGAERHRKVAGKAFLEKMFLWRRS